MPGAVRPGADAQRPSPGEAVTPRQVLPPPLPDGASRPCSPGSRGRGYKHKKASEKEQPGPRARPAGGVCFTSLIGFADKQQGIKLIRKRGTELSFVHNAGFI